MIIECEEGFTLNLNEKVKVFGKGIVSITDLKKGDKVFFDPVKEFGIKGNYNEGICIGWMVGDGSLVSRPIYGILLFAKNSYANDLELVEFFIRRLNELHYQYQKNYVYSPSIYEAVTKINSTLLGYIAHGLGMKQGRKHIVPENCGKEFYRGFLKGIFSADGGVHIRDKIVYLNSSELELLKQIQEVLLGFKIYSRIGNGTEEGDVIFPDGKTYFCRKNYALRIQGIDIFRFYNEIGFLQSIQTEKLVRSLNSYKRKTPMVRQFIGTIKLVKDQLF